MSVSTNRVNYFADRHFALAAELTCMNRDCDADLEPVNIGKILAGRSSTAILRCPKCRAQYSLHVALSPRSRTRTGPGHLSPQLLVDA